MTNFLRAARPQLRSPLLVGSVAAAALLVAVNGAQAGGQCYAEVATPPVYRTHAEQVMVRPASQVARVVPGVYQTVSERVLASPRAADRSRRSRDLSQRRGARAAAPERQVARVVPAVYGVQTRP